MAILGTELDAAYQRTLDGLRRDHPIFEVAEGRIDLEKLDALDEPSSLRALRARIDAMLPDVDLPELLLEIATRTRFITAFTHEREPSARLSDLEVSIIAVLIAQACNVGYKPLVDEKIPALRLERLKYVARHYVRPETLIAANAMIVDYHAKLPLAIEWGGGEVANIDGLRFVVPARNDPRPPQPALLSSPPRSHRDRHHHRPLRRHPHDRRAGHPARRALPARRPVGPADQRPPAADHDRHCWLHRHHVRLLPDPVHFQLSPRLADTGGARFWVLDPHATTDS